jgi:hypothetical protein
MQAAAAVVLSNKSLGMEALAVAGAVALRLVLQEQAALA